MSRFTSMRSQRASASAVAADNVVDLRARYRAVREGGHGAALIYKYRLPPADLRHGIISCNVRSASISGHNVPSGLALQRATIASSQAAPNTPKDGT
jgi:hypothetical protein